MRQARKNKRSRREWLVAVLACLLAVLMLLPMVVMVASNLTLAGAASAGSIQSQINELKNKNKGLASQKAQLKSQLNGIKAEKSQAMQRRNNLEQQINVLQEEIDNLEAQLVQYQALIEEKKQQVADNQAREEAQFELFCKQVRAMEEEGSQSYWSILLSAGSFTELLDRVNMVNDIADYNDMVCTQLEIARAALEEARAELEQAERETAETKTQSEAAQKELKGQKAEVQGLIDEIAADEKEAKKALDALNAAARQMDAEIARKEKELQAAIAQSKGSGRYQFDPGSGWYWPLPKERVSVTSFFGPRKDPISGKRSNHSGTDIGAYSGTEIYAAHGGVVLTSEYHSSYGNYVVISRGDGYTTLYAHMSKRGVKAGDTVSQGQVIGYVGSTGRSTAPHLHFEVRVNGARQDALKYYPNIKWKNNTGFPYK